MGILLYWKSRMCFLSSKTVSLSRFAMHQLQVETLILASAPRCFDLARSVDAHVQSAAASRERAVAGRTSGLLELDDEVTWEGRHFGLRQRLTSRITVFQRPSFFQDRMTRGAFKSLEHDHCFVDADSGGTMMIDTMRFQAPGGIFARPIEKYVLGPYLRRFLEQRGQTLKQMAESENWKWFVPPG